MKPVLSFEKQVLNIGDFGSQSSVPAIMEMSNTQNATRFELEEDDDIFAGYEQITNSFPYREYGEYSRTVRPTETNVAVLENDYLKVTFLIDFGGRMWSLIDKTTDINLLYTNDVIRPSNLSVRNAWFSGGVEWNMGVIGHSPFTVDPIFASSLKNEKGSLVLRMYEYERIRKATYQMDFWLDEEDRYLNCRMRIVNENDGLTPMYWWSNMAVPEYANGRVIVPAGKAFTYRKGVVSKVELPIVDGIDVSRYKDIPGSVDYFFDIPNEKKHFIANLNQEGYGLLQASTSRLKGRKLFSWGNNSGSDQWQEFLTDKAGRYIEIQAGLERTQYGCFPMQPHTACEWIEVYGPISVDQKVMHCAFEQAVELTEEQVLRLISFEDLEKKLVATKESVAKKEVSAEYSASGFGALENLYRKKTGLKPLSGHLDFGICAGEQKQWMQLLEHGYFEDMDETSVPESYMADAVWFTMLENSMEGMNEHNWYACYQLGLMYFWKKDLKKSRKYLKRALERKQNDWSVHALAVVELCLGNDRAASSYALNGILRRGFDLSYVKDCMKVLIRTKSYQELLYSYSTLSEEIAGNGRILLFKVETLYEIGEYEKAYRLLTQNQGLQMDDIREGENSLLQMWTKLSEKLGYFDENKEVPKIFNFSAI